MARGDGSATVAEVVGRTLAELGATHVFGVVGSGNFHVTNALIAAGVRFVAARHEGGAATMADAFARTSGTPALLSLHQGCGLTNALTGITEAAKSRTPLVVLAAESAASSPHSNFRVDQTAMAESVGAIADRVASAATAADDVRRAFRRAVDDRRTVVLNLPLDVQALPCEPEAAGTAGGPGFADTRVRPSKEAAAALARILTRAERPVFVAGRGARSPEARDALVALAERCGALLATSAVARGLFNGLPYAIDVSGGFSSPKTAELIAQADVIVGWGCALNMWTMRHGRLIGEGTTVVQVDDDLTALGRHRPVDLGVLGDIAATAGDVAAGLGTSTGYRTQEIAEAVAGQVRWRDVPYDDEGDGERIDPRTLSILLDDLLPAERVIGVDSGNFLGYPTMFLQVPDEQGLCFTQAFQCVGLGLATAIGAALARPDRLPVAALGDGGALMGLSELETVVRLGLPMAIVIYNDSLYGAEVHHFGPSGESLESVTFPETDFAAIGRGHGCEGVTVRGPADLAAVRRWIDGPRDTPIVIDAKVTRNGASWWLEEAFRGH
ncbi:thiamine pyrophosphate-binding protein [Nonomuraea sp. NBC_01738]|uniref:thiamine pyrophosphate-binding protein n=1 Tax=Nonomuraea sp. NBC_01738 TaxID=2976003 RepID=UPI002E1162F1|nr:thiamine pyrophosphate-binding protein [Nonomuraea sp. NBC_01738]